MSADGDTLLARAAAVIENARDIRGETQRVVDSARLQRLHRELVTKMLQIERLIARPKKKHRLM
ncbi:MAG TPA: hypothetical protein VGQ21_19170 [Thermoanaerobaculia bacterium]|jgi:hypothetical protein|nr:hypothetical protein [Thermoanaerobaculia bacterium]